MGGHRGYNICPWLKIGKREICGKSCREQYCKAHRACIRKGSRTPRPCLICGIGVRSEIQVCRGCRREGMRRKKKIEDFLKPSPIQFPKFLPAQPTWPFPNFQPLQPTRPFVKKESVLKPDKSFLKPLEEPWSSAKLK